MNVVFSVSLSALPGKLHAKWSQLNRVAAPLSPTLSSLLTHLSVYFGCACRVPIQYQAWCGPGRQWGANCQRPSPGALPLKHLLRKKEKRIQRAQTALLPHPLQPHWAPQRGGVGRWLRTGTAGLDINHIGFASDVPSLVCKMGKMDPTLWVCSES